MRNIYLANEHPETAMTNWLGAFTMEPKYESIEVWEADGRVTGEPVYARQCAPNFKASAMDGIAVVASSTYAAATHNPIALEEGKDFVYVDTGDVIDGGWNAVIMIEEIQKVSENGNIIEIRDSVSPWKSVRAMGEDMVAGEMIVPKGKRLSPEDIGALLQGGVTKISVVCQPRVGILPTGSEITSPWDTQKKGSIIDSNAFMFSGLCAAEGAVVNRYNPVLDDIESLTKAIKTVVSENDFVIINAGSSAGSEDYTSTIIENLGKVTTHGVALKPGKPTVLGVIDNKPIIGTPGYAVAAYIIFQKFAKPMIQILSGRQPLTPITTKAVLSKRIVSSLKHEEYVPIKMGLVNGKKIATPINRGSGITMTLVRADGFLVVPLTSEGHHAGETMPVQLINPYIQVENTLVTTGSHDLMLDIASNLMLQSSPYLLSSSHVGSQGGLMALKREECHMAPIHLLDEETGIYNEIIGKSYFKEQPMALIKGVKRSQGFIVQPGNPKNITCFADLTKDGVEYINRQRGAGTRVLLDYQLKKEGISVQTISGYSREAITHTAVAAEVLSGAADVGLGVLSAAKALNLDFVPVEDEDYDFLVTAEHVDTPMIREFIRTIQGELFQKELELLGGYATIEAGEVRYL